MNVKASRNTHVMVLESAASMLRSKGISGARVADVMHGAGLTVGGFCAHFDFKETLVDGVMRRGAEAKGR
jgi:TetR/AcrR family transcriptional repressor of nem operon